MKQVTTGMFSLPGISFDRDEISAEILAEMTEWVEKSECGMQMNERLFSFKNDGHRNFFILKWSDYFKKD
jgi:hypothetical protein